MDLDLQTILMLRKAARWAPEVEPAVAVATWHYWVRIESSTDRVFPAEWRGRRVLACVNDSGRVLLFPGDKCLEDLRHQGIRADEATGSLPLKYHKNVDEMIHACVSQGALGKYREES